MLDTAVTNDLALDREEILRSIRNMVPLRHLNDSEFAAITGEMQIEKRDRGKEFFSVNRDDQFIFYLLSGEITITDAEGNCFDVAGGQMCSDLGAGLTFCTP